MDEQAIRRWAWDEAQRYSWRDADDKPLDDQFSARLNHADDLAAWVMSGRTPESRVD